MPNRERFRMCEVPGEVRTSSTGALLPQDGLADAITPDQVFAMIVVAEIVCCKIFTQRW
jgi:hypothetical protein